ncbi:MULTISPECIES: PBSX family phage terminase large subunit [unclassified Bradyrhizobium]|uniref:PBSX family phage terminase large subunit n=1 Tax=unclassified Bradyrhizobium TaxID=2631580 RepID=UPI001BA4B931|nr:MULTISPECIES: phage terminase large subunit [unclassified Bradyrhizobium]MBR1206603.1 phage terminase large subunit [Bradyrhizobium sp. AUGA SZCCT0124]MBR1315419.1 phage terminase large subunit [Bradyrhizobium sp. AUGA SZCCT0051]MBR1338519.1 phage terminase large subunit [Bradyrhizobium sp. AUGA SZCCT0105]MBR1356174.1 phage terminase large subunit [Bradyrhizobium sp. AUGA SZCCT0045]
MTAAQILLPPKLVPVFTGDAMYRGSHGGRGSAKTRSFATMAAVHGLRCARAGQDGVVVCGREFMNSLADSSFEEVKGAIYSTPFLAEAYEVGETYIRTKCRRINFAFIGLRHNLDSVKSKARIRLAWVDEAEPVSDVAWTKLDATVREEGAEVWVTWNPERKKSATHLRWRADPPPHSKIVELNWRDNPFFPSTLNQKRLNDLEKRPDQYDWIWEGGFRTAVEGAYYAKAMAQAKAEGRITFVPRDPLLQTRAYFDIGGTGARADAVAIWIAQFSGQKINVLDYYEAQGQPLSVHIDWMRSRGYGNAWVILPHDGAHGDKVFATSYESAIREAGFDVLVIPNQGAGAASARIETGRRLFPRIFFNADTTEPGRDALGWYHEKKSNDERNIGLGPNHDWSSHGADGFGLMCIHYDQPAGSPPPRERYRSSGRSSGGGSWQSA